MLRELSAVPRVTWVGVALGEALVQHDHVPPQKLLEAIDRTTRFKGQIVVASTGTKPAPWLQQAGGKAPDQMTAHAEGLSPSQTAFLLASP